MSDEHPRWTEIEHLPEWDEEFYHIYTAKKFGKWVMMKTLRPEYADDPRYQAMIEQEFDVRYSLAHPNIVMINDFEDVPGVGRCIVTDDVYGDSLRKLIYEQRPSLSHQSTADDIYNYGKVLDEALKAAKINDPVLRRVVRRCTDEDPRRRFSDMQQVHLALEGRKASLINLIIFIFLILMTLLVIWLISPYRPMPPEATL